MRLYDVEGALTDWEEAVAREASLVKKWDTPELRSSVESALQQIKAVSIDPTSAQYYLLMGRAYTIFGRYALALQAYTSAGRISPEEIQAGLGSANIYQKLGQPDEALKSLTKMLEQHPNSALLCSRVGFIYLGMGSTAQAVRYLERACSLNPADWNSHLALAEVLIKQGRHEAAMARYQQTLQLEPNCSPALVGMAECCKELYRFEEAISYFQKAIAAEPRDFKAMCQLGVLCIQLGGLDLGIESLHKARELNPADVEVYSNLAKAYQQKGDLGTAAEYYAKTVTLNPRDYFAAYNLGLIYRSQGRIEEAATAFGTAASLRPNDSQYQYQLARATIELGRAQPALEAARKAVSLNPHNKEIQLVYARACLFCRLFSEAHDAAKAALHIDPQNLEGVLYQAQAQLELGLIAEAEAGFQESLKLSPLHYGALRGLGRVYVKMGNVARAMEHLQQAMEVDPDDPGAVQDLCLLYLSSRQPEKIVDCAESVLRRRNNDGRLTGAFLENWLTFLQEKGVYEIGTALLDKFAEHFPDQVKLHQRQLRWELDWSELLRSRGDLLGAQQSLHRVLKSMPNNAEILGQLREIEDELGRIHGTNDAFAEPVPEPIETTRPPQPSSPPVAETDSGESSTQRHLLENTAGGHNSQEDWLKLSQRYLEFALELEKAGWLKEATLILWDAFSLPECDESLQLHSHRILQNWSDRLEQEGQTQESQRVRELMGVESAAPPVVEPPPLTVVLPPRRPLSEAPKALLEPPPSLDWMDEEPPLPTPAPVSTQAFEPEPVVAGLGEPLPTDDSWLTPPPDLGVAPLDVQTRPPVPEFATEIPPLPSQEEPARLPAEDIAAWMRSLGDEGLSTPTTPPVPSQPAPEPQMGLRSPLGAPREGFSSAETFPSEEPVAVPSFATEESREDEPVARPSGEGIPAVPQEAAPVRRPPVITSALSHMSHQAPPPAPPAPEPVANVGRPGADDQAPAPGGYRPAPPPEPPAPVVQEATPPPEFEVNLTGGEDRDALLRLLHRHPEHKGVRAALYRSFADDVAGLVRAFRDLVAEDPDEVYHVLNLARAFAHSGSDSMAILQFRKYVKLEATSEGYRELGEAYERMGKGELASQAFRRAEQLLAEEELDD